jgi:PKD repeat protein
MFHVVDSRGCGAVITYTISVTSSLGCPLMIGDRNVFLTYKGVSSGCSEAGNSTCAISEPIQFQPSAIGYSFNCFTHAFTWNFGDGELAGGERVTHVYRQSGTFAVTLTIANAQQSIQLAKSIVIAPTRHRPVRR